VEETVVQPVAPKDAYKGPFWVLFFFILLLLFGMFFCMMGGWGFRTPYSMMWGFNRDYWPSEESKEKASSPDSTTPTETNTESTANICTNTVEGYQFEVPDVLFTNSFNEANKCVFFSFNAFTFPEVWDGPLTPIIVSMTDKSTGEFIETTVLELQPGVFTGAFAVDRGYQSTYITGVYIDEHMMSGRSLYAVAVEVTEGKILVFSAWDLTGVKLETFKELVRSVELL